MQRIERVRAIAERHGHSLAEYLIIHIATAFAMTPEEAAKFIGAPLASHGHGNVDCRAAVENCMKKGLVGLSPAGVLILTSKGLALAQAITNELTTPYG